MNDKHRRFVDEYLVDLHGTDAAIRAGYSKKTARIQASQLLARPDVRAAVAEKQAERSAGAGDRASRAAAELEGIGFMDVGTFRDAAPALLNVKRAALVDLLKLDGKFTERHEHTGKDGGPIQTEEVSNMEAARRIAHVFGRALKDV